MDIAKPVRLKYLVKKSSDTDKIKGISLMAILIFALFFPRSMLAQDSLCTCAGYSTILFTYELEEYFPPAIIKKEKIKEVIVFASGYANTDSAQKVGRISNENLVENGDKVLIIKFNQSGYATSIFIHYNKLGQPTRKSTFTRGKNNKILTFATSSLDSNGKVTKYSQRNIYDFTYDSENRLVKTKLRDVKDKIVPDKVASYTKYVYDKKGRIIKSVWQSYYEGRKPFIQTTFFKFSENNSSAFQIKDNEGMFSSGTITYNPEGKLLSRTSMHSGSEKSPDKEFWKYDSEGKLITHEVIAGGNTFSECPDGGIYTDNFYYDQKRLPSIIITKYNNAACALTFMYK